MDKPEVCEWSKCQNKSKVYVVLDGEKYWFCSHEHADKFWESIQDRY